MKSNLSYKSVVKNYEMLNFAIRAFGFSYSSFWLFYLSFWLLISLESASHEPKAPPLRSVSLGWLFFGGRSFRRKGRREKERGGSSDPWPALYAVGSPGESRAPASGLRALLLDTHPHTPDKALGQGPLQPWRGGKVRPCTRSPSSHDELRQISNVHAPNEINGDLHLARWG